MSFILKNKVIVTILSMSFALLTLGVSASGCTLAECDEREICVGADCECGDKCATDDNCNKKDRAGNYIEQCFAYEFTPEHGVCVSAEFMTKHKNATPDKPNGRHLPLPSTSGS